MTYFFFCFGGTAGGSMPSSIKAARYLAPSFASAAICSTWWRIHSTIAAVISMPRARHAAWKRALRSFGIRMLSGSPVGICKTIAGRQMATKRHSGRYSLDAV